MIRKLLTAILACVLVLSFVAIAGTAGYPKITTDVAEIDKNGNLVLKISASGLFSQGYGYNDIIKVSIAGRKLEMPIVSDYEEVDSGSPLFLAVQNEAEEEDRTLIAIKMGDLATSAEIAEETGTGEWKYRIKTPVAVKISMKQKGGYTDEYLAHQLTRTYKRSDYPHLTDEQYANFRNVTTTGMGHLALYRSSSPVNPKINRNKEADEALNNAGIRTVLNLADSRNRMRSYKGFRSSYYSQRDVIPLSMNLHFSGERFREKLAEGLTFLAEHDGPYLVHCTEGKDRCGFVSAMLECLMGATPEEVIADYMVTYYNYYGVEPGTRKYDAISRTNIEKSLAEAFGVKDFGESDPAKCAEEYLRAIGLSDQTIAAVRKNLGRDYAK